MPGRRGERENIDLSTVRDVSLGGRTHFGAGLRELITLLSIYSGKNNFVRWGLTQSQYTLASRLSNDVGLAGSMASRTRDKFINAIADAYDAHFKKTEISEATPGGFRTRVVEDLETALMEDKKVAMVIPLALSFASRVARFTDRNFLELDCALMDPEVGEKIKAVMDVFYSKEETSPSM